MAKQIDPDLVQRIRLRKRINDKIDRAVDTGRKHQQSDFIIELIDKSFRQFCLSLHMEKMREGAGTDAEECKDIVCNLMANMAVEFLLNVVERGGDANEMVEQANHILRLFSSHFNAAIQVNYGLTTEITDDRIGGQTPERPQ